MWNSLKCYARDLHFGRREKRGKEGERGRERGAFPICNPPFPEKEEREERSEKEYFIFAASLGTTL